MNIGKIPANVVSVTCSEKHNSVLSTINPLVKLGNKYKVTLIPEGGFKVKRAGIDDRRIVRAFGEHKRRCLYCTGVQAGLYIVDPEQSNEDYLICLPLSSVLIF